ncbi:MAG: ferrochelatase [Flavobacteriales bacterium]|nr:ferrochelatase [Flavobacteriia bacterium]NCP52798.1 ferrochelatase [Flavobacteriales bacterium]PIV92989.1 MAG: ferrochelatase [Flavobacteriaceae bacterium CG17_big_fil_post_rev_8_21_14_2_50_33_15]PIY13460.1 MAG: ferrochelatase [Flavobacteriaceae bacterium CG_4_10_14_3_um_filter_33_47]PJB18472.1 MAG: ferrochelatase [Flavobacteriaceae bacterium CG_4_9_14_3_um_filter_33_16]
MKKGILLVNLGSPDSPEPKDVKKYLGEFLMDERVIDVPLWARTLLVKGIILKTRPKASAAAYKKIWWKEGSPLIVLSERLQNKVQKQVDIPVGLAMRYGSMSIEKGLQDLVDKGVEEVLLIPLYPQFAMATTETIVVLANEIQQAQFPNLKIESLPAFYNNLEYIEVLSKSIKKHLEGKTYEHLLFSYHGVPERHIRKSDITKSHCKIDGNCCKTPSKAHEFCYRHQCYEVTRLVGETLKLKEGTFSTSFQSRLGFDPWLQPYTDRTIEHLGKEGIKNMAIVTPAFVSDCLETLEEIAMEGEDIFHEMGGKNFTTIPCLNDDDSWVALLSKWIKNWA